jgi:hypothetical protein
MDVEPRRAPQPPGTRRRRLTLAPCRDGLPAIGPSGSHFSPLDSEGSGSGSDGADIPLMVVQHVLDGEEDEGWTPVSRRKKKSEAETVANFWNEIGYPTSALRFWESSCRPSSTLGTSDSFCRSVEVYGAVQRVSSPSRSPPAVSPRRGACSSPTGVRLTRCPRMGAWRSPLPRRRVTPPPVLGDFLDLASSSSSKASAPSSASCSPAVASEKLLLVGNDEPGVIGGGVIQTPANHATSVHADCGQDIMPHRF